jgi:hypothetical protein
MGSCWLNLQGQKGFATVQKLSKRPQTKRCDGRMKIDLKESKENSKCDLGWKFNKGSWEEEDKFHG